MATPLRGALVAVLAVVLAGCGQAAGTEITTSDPAPSASVQAAEGVAVIDVRTQAEFDTGHLSGARLLDLNSGEFAATIPSLDPAGAYYLYCRSGNRAGQAAALLEQAGFTNVVNLGSVEQASATTGIPIVTD